MPGRTILLLVVASLFNAAIAVQVLQLASLPIDPETESAAMRAWPWVLYAVVATSAACAVAPWVLARRGRGRAASVAAAVPLGALMVAVLALQAMGR